MTAKLSAAAVWRITPALVAALDERLGPPLDSYINGSQVWLLDDARSGDPVAEPAAGDARALEWHLHPVGGYRPPRDCSTYGLWDQVSGQLAAGVDPAALVLGSERRPLTSLWDGLESFAVFGAEPEPAELGQLVTEVLGIAPDAVGLVDHERIGDVWERSDRAASLIALMFDELRGAPGDMTG